jgi:hypothetical protein
MKFLQLTAKLSVVIAGVASLLLAPGATARARKAHSESAPVMVEFTITAPYLLKGRLCTGVRPEDAAALPLLRKLYLKINSHYKWVSNLNDLTNRVHIGGAQMALDFVRLRTGENTCVLFPSPHPEMDLVRRRTTSHRLPEIKIERKKNGYVLHRPLISGYQYDAILITEYVTTNGEYKVLDRQRIGTAAEFGATELMPELM